MRILTDELAWLIKQRYPSIDTATDEEIRQLPEYKITLTMEKVKPNE